MVAHAVSGSGLGGRGWCSGSDSGVAAVVQTWRPFPSVPAHASPDFAAVVHVSWPAESILPNRQFYSCSKSLAEKTLKTPTGASLRPIRGGTRCAVEAGDTTRLSRSPKAVPWAVLATKRAYQADAISAKTPMREGGLGYRGKSVTPVDSSPLRDGLTSTKCAAHRGLARAPPRQQLLRHGGSSSGKQLQRVR